MAHNAAAPPGPAGTPPRLTLVDDASEERFEEWYRSYSPGLKASCVRLLGDDALAQDVVQETLLRAWTRREQFADPAQVGPWLWCVARNLCRDHLRRGKKLVVSDVLPEAPDFRADPTAPLEIEQERTAVRAALGALSRRHQEVLVLRDVNGVEYDELATRLGVSPTGARAVLFRARKSLREALSGSDAFGAFLPVGLARRIADSLRRAALFVSERTGSRGSIALEVAAATLVAVTTIGPAASLAPAAQAPGAVSSSAGGANAADVNGVVADASRAVDGAVAMAGGTGAPGAPAVPAAVATDDWHASIALGGQRGTPGSEVVAVRVEVTAAENRPLQERAVEALPNVDLGVLQRPAPPDAPPAPSAS